MSEQRYRVVCTQRLPSGHVILICEDREDPPTDGAPGGLAEHEVAALLAQAAAEKATS